MPDSLKVRLGLSPDGQNLPPEERMTEYANLKLASRGLPIYGTEEQFQFLEFVQSLLANYKEKNKLLSDYLCPADRRIHAFLSSYLAGVDSATERHLPSSALVLERHGLARTLSLPPDEDVFRSPILSSYRVKQGICHNPQHDRRTTEGVFHITEGGFAVPADKKAVPKEVFANLLRAALHPPPELLQLPFTSTSSQEAHLWISLLLRPVVRPAIDDLMPMQSMETRFFAPASLVANLDFVESIFGNAGDPFLPENDAALDVEHWTGHTGCVILAPHLIQLKKKDLGLPHVSGATERQKNDGMCWESEDELYNEGGAFKITCRDHRGVIVTLIADNYFGYCKKEVKTQISFAANLYGNCEEEHAGGALIFPRFDHGEDFRLSEFKPAVDHQFAWVKTNCAELMDTHPEGYGINRSFPDIYFIPENTAFDLRKQQLSWTTDGVPATLKFLPGITYMLPSGYKIEMRKSGERWRIIGTQAEGTFCHKPCTVSGGGKSEISKAISDAMLTGAVFISDLKADLDRVEDIINRPYDGRYQNPTLPVKPSRRLLSPERSLGSVVKLLSPNPDYTPEYNRWLERIPHRIRDLVLLVKRYYRPEWGTDWRSRFTVDLINGRPGFELKYRKEVVLAQYLRVGFAADGSWRTFTLRNDFHPAHKIQMEDDISASVVAPAGAVKKYLHPLLDQPSYKFTHNCECRLFQRPDEAIVRGYDKIAEADFSSNGNFFSNYEPLDRQEARRMIEDAILFDQFSAPIQQVIREFVAESEPEYLMSTSHPRVVNGRPSKNPRYLQVRPDLQSPRDSYLASLGARLHRQLTPDQPVYFPVNSVVPGRRNNRPESGTRPLCVYGPVHYQEWPEFFMDAVASLTGKSPSTTGAGSEGALTKGPFNALPPIIDLNNALVSYLLTGDTPYTTSAAWLGPMYRVDHDISLLIPEIWSRMHIFERAPRYLIENEFLEKVRDIEHNGRVYQASRLGYRITERFVTAFFGRVFSDPASVFTDDMLRPELQDFSVFLDGVDNIVSTQRQVALQYFEDGTIELACPPLKALLGILAHGKWEGMTADSPEFRSMFTLEALLPSEWYMRRLESRQDVEVQLWERHVQSLDDYLDSLSDPESLVKQVRERLDLSRQRLREVKSRSTRQLVGSIGTDPAALREHRLLDQHASKRFAPSL